MRKKKEQGHMAPVPFLRMGPLRFGAPEAIMKTKRESMTGMASFISSNDILPHILEKSSFFVVFVNIEHKMLYLYFQTV